MNYAAALAYFPKITYRRYHRLADYFGSLEKAWEAEIDEFIKAGMEEAIGYEFIIWREQTSVEKITEELAQKNITTIARHDANYPRLLAEIADPPQVLFTRGALPLGGGPAVAIVGTRKCTAYGKQVTEQLTTDLARQGVVIVSGLALGIDGIAHEAALGAVGRTIAVLGSGVDRSTVYPASHQHLGERIIAAGGALISEYPPGFKPTQYSFPARNRIIAGLSLGALITEAPLESGALITAHCALDYNREVFAAPHPITSIFGAGGNKLIKLGATLVTTAQDILDTLEIHQVQEIVAINQSFPATPHEAKLLPLLSREPEHIDQLIKLSGLDSATANSTLTMMEMKGTVKNIGGMLYILK